MVGTWVFIRNSFQLLRKVEIFHNIKLGGRERDGIILSCRDAVISENMFLAKT